MGFLCSCLVPDKKEQHKSKKDSSRPRPRTTAEHVRNSFSGEHYRYPPFSPEIHHHE